MTGRRSPKELGRGERILPGLFRLRLPLPYPGIPHCNAWAVAAGDGIVLFDTGMHEPGSMVHLERALGMCNLTIDNVRLVVCTHAHADHYGQAATILQRTGCELWMNHNHEHATRWAADPKAGLERRLEIGRQCGVPAELLRAYAAGERSLGSGIAGIVAPDTDLLDGVTVDTDLGPWTAYETPGHAPSHVCLFQADRRLLISGDHLLGRISLYFDFGYTPDPVGEFLRSLDVVEGLGARLCLAGHGRTFTDVGAHIAGNRALVAERLRQTASAIAGADRTVFEIAPHVYGEQLTALTAPWLLAETLSLLVHLRREGRAHRVIGEPDVWSAA